MSALGKRGWLPILSNQKLSWMTLHDGSRDRPAVLSDAAIQSN
jgi:hypothetical protein